MSALLAVLQHLVPPDLLALIETFYMGLIYFFQKLKLDDSKDNISLLQSNNQEEL